MANWYEREFASLNQALLEIIRNLDENIIKDNTGKTKDYFRRCSDPRPDNKRNLQHNDSIKLDIACLREGMGHPLLSSHQLQIKKFMSQSNQHIDLDKTIVNMTIRLGSLADEIEKAMDPDSPGGEKIDMYEKDDLFKKIVKLEETIAQLKVAIGI